MGEKVHMGAAHMLGRTRQTTHLLWFIYMSSLEISSKNAPEAGKHLDRLTQLVQYPPTRTTKQGIAIFASYVPCFAGSTRSC